METHGWDKIKHTHSTGHVISYMKYGELDGQDERPARLGVVCVNDLLEGPALWLLNPGELAEVANAKYEAVTSEFDVHPSQDIKSPLNCYFVELHKFV